MDINIDDILAKINALSQCIAKDSITPPSLAGVLKDMADYCAAHSDSSGSASADDLSELAAAISSVQQSLGEAESRIDDAANALALLAAGTKATVSCVPSVVYKGQNTMLTLSGAIQADVSATLALYLDGSAIAAGTGKSLRQGKLATLTEDAEIMFTASVCGVLFKAKSTVYARNAVIYGFGTDPADVQSDGSMASARLSAAGTYSATATTDGVHFYLLVPSDVGLVSQFSMGGAPFAMSSEELSVGGSDYTVYTSGAIYNSGATVTVKAE